jgi:hypothetical protein
MAVGKADHGSSNSYVQYADHDVEVWDGGGQQREGFLQLQVSRHAKGHGHGSG